VRQERERKPSEPLPFGALFALILGTFMAVLDASIVNVALPRIMAIFNATTDQIQWVLTIYLLVGGMVIPATGYLGLRFGYKASYLSCIAFFTVTSMLCGFSWNTNALIAARALQAIGGGMMIPLSMAIVYQIWPREKIGVAMGLWGLTMTLAPAIGPTLGGYLVDYFSWRLIFYINLPVGILTLLIGWLFLPETRPVKGAKLDLLGLLLISGSCFALLLALSKGHEWGWGSQSIVTLLTGAFFGLLLFFLWELTVPNPVIDVRLLRIGAFSLALLTSSLVSVALFIGIFLVPVFTQSVQGYSPLQTGLILMPAALSSGLVMPLAGRLFDKIGAALPAVAGLGLVAGTTYLLRHITVDMPVHHLQVLLCVRGVGLGLSMMPLMTAGMNTVPGPQVGEASALMNVVRQVAASFGIALVTSVLQNRTAFHSARLSESLSYLAPLGYFNFGQVQAKVAALLGQTAAPAAAQGLLAGAVQKQAAVLAVGDAFVVALALVLVGLPPAGYFTPKKVAAAHRRAEGLLGKEAPAGSGPAALPPEGS